MHHREVTPTGEYVCRYAGGEDWRGGIEAFARERSVEAAFFTGLGAVEDAEVWYYHQDSGEYDPVEFDEHLEVSACVGNVSLLDDEPFAHTHAVLGPPSGETLSGHLNAGTVFAGELHLRAFEEPLVRERHPETDLDLWLSP